MRRSEQLGVLSLALLCVASAACQAAAPPSQGTAPCGPEADRLANSVYSSELVESGTVQLEGGEYRTPAAPGSASQIVIQRTDHLACGELNGVPTAAVVLVSSAGGSGAFYSLHALRIDEAPPEEEAFTVLGDRVRVEQVSIAENLIQVDLVTHAAEDPQCCPTQAVTQSYALEGSQLRLVSTTPRDQP